MGEVTRVCRKCHQEKPLEEFYTYPAFVTFNRCKECCRAQARKYDAGVRAGRRRVLTRYERLNRNNSLRSFTPLQRTGPVRQKRAAPRRSDRVRDVPYLLRVKTLPCLLCGTGCCWGDIEADHAGPRPLGRKADDSTAIPLCTQHHRERTDYSGFFRGFTAVVMRLWADKAIEETRATLGWKEAA